MCVYGVRHWDLADVPGCLGPSGGIQFERVIGEEGCLGARV